ncbi:hypothetical protein [Nocardioides sp. MH1]|uniref:hypothetical protein n=1 Tax=Nocardioides sp. MH1 TaxID=3242490 RepID=UPI003522AA54
MTNRLVAAAGTTALALALTACSGGSRVSDSSDGPMDTATGPYADIEEPLLDFCDLVDIETVESATGLVGLASSSSVSITAGEFGSKEMSCAATTPSLDDDSAATIVRIPSGGQGRTSERDLLAFGENAQSVNGLGDWAVLTSPGGGHDEAAIPDAFSAIMTVADGDNYWEFMVHRDSGVEKSTRAAATALAREVFPAFAGLPPVSVTDLTASPWRPEAVLDVEDAWVVAALSDDAEIRDMRWGQGSQPASIDWITPTAIRDGMSKSVSVGVTGSPDFWSRELERRDHNAEQSGEEPPEPEALEGLGDEAWMFDTLEGAGPDDGDDTTYGQRARGSTYIAWLQDGAWWTVSLTVVGEMVSTRGRALALAEAVAAAG